ncbi:hypothetical protein BDV98DRAFT_567146 [Pterulicium gracile]|uniref:Transcription activator of gluconeogenesis ERT1 n=1 Tax=Pterulicium gracile TaxID=1884261 RepID=A0A5C3QHL5_9AGAR|nr:hypothetical protein BDV98DRAFT_567146 [Pterula gracilis]
MSTLHASLYNSPSTSITETLTSPPVYINPAQMQAQAGPSSVPVHSRKKIAPNPKRRRSEVESDDSLDSGSQRPTTQQRKRDGPKKKKASRACLHCQKAHLTCDDSRPCQRCVKRGLANNCTEGHRKKAKYLLDDEELEQMKGKTPTTASPTASTGPQIAADSTTVQQAQPPLPADSYPEDPYFGVPFDSNFSFGSEAANLEYSILSAILGNPSPPDSNMETSIPETPPQPGYQWNSGDGVSQSTYNNASELSEPNGFLTSFQNSETPASLHQSSENGLTLASSSPFTTSYTPYTSSSISGPTDMQLQYPPISNPQQPIHPLHPRYTLIPRPYAPASTTPTVASPSASTSSPATTSSTLPNVPSTSTVAKAKSPLQAIMDRVNTPYDYTQSYHFLMKYLQSRFEKNDILRVVRALAIFRPSLIALQMPLSLDDEVFLEKCFQRSLLELEKLISFSGTPTAVWRRTGEICLVSPEFCTVTEWPSEKLLGKKKYMYELFENQSVVEYWENFAAQAFENTTQSVYSHCVLLKPSGAPIPATFCFTIRKDLFDIPSVVIGQWLPLL